MGNGNGQALLEQARKLFEEGQYNPSFDIYERLSHAYPQQAIEILAEAFDHYQRIADEDRYTLYQSRHYHFGLQPADTVLDVGSGHIPFKYATHLADIALDDHTYGRAGEPFKYVNGKPVFECNIENLPFENKEFDFVYCSHVLEHVNQPEKACTELMRVAKRGYIETPTKGKDIWLSIGKMSNHRWAIENIHDKLVFTEYNPTEIAGLQNNILLDMHTAPQSRREKAFSALIYLKANLVNTMLLWESSFEYVVFRAK
jgi:ubiquinone/menaquinone biosynthesis C-methylase UbiE